MKIIATKYNYTNSSLRENFKGGSPPKAMLVGIDFLQNLKNMQTFKIVIENASLETLKSLIANPAIDEQKRAIAIEQMSKFGETLKKTSKTKKPSKTNAEKLLESINKDMAMLKKKIAQLAGMLNEGKGMGIKTAENETVSGLTDDINKFKTNIVEKLSIKQKNFEMYKKYLENKDCDNILALHILENANKIEKQDVGALVISLIDYAKRTKDDKILVLIEKFCNARKNKVYGLNQPLISNNTISRIYDTAYEIGDLNYMTGEKIKNINLSKALRLSNFALEKKDIKWFEENMNWISFPDYSPDSQKIFINYLKLFNEKTLEGEKLSLFSIDRGLDKLTSYSIWDSCSDIYKKECASLVTEIIENQQSKDNIVSNDSILKNIKKNCKRLVSLNRWS